MPLSLYKSQQGLIKKIKRLYRVFGSGSYHKPYAVFTRLAREINKGRKISLLRTADTRMAGYFYAMHRSLRVKRALKGTIHSVQWNDYKAGQRETNAALDIEQLVFWRAIFILLRCVFPALKALRLADSNRPGMDKIYYLAHKTEVALESESMDLDDKELFPFPSEDDTEENDEDDMSDEDDKEMDEAEAETDECSISSEETEDEDAEEVSKQVMAAWKKRAKTMQSE